MAAAGATVPRNFKLLDELDEAEKSTRGGADVSLGLAQTDDSSLSHWNCSIFAQAGGGEPRMWMLSLHCDKDYPSKPPTIKFSSKVTMDCVDAKGNVSCARARAGRARRALGARAPFARRRRRRCRRRRCRRRRCATRLLTACLPAVRRPRAARTARTLLPAAGHCRQGAVPGLLELEQDAARRVPGAEGAHHARLAPAAA